MSLFSIEVTGNYELVCLRDTISQAPAYEYQDGKRTNQQKTDADGHPLYRIVGALPIIDSQAFDGCTVHTTTEFDDLQVQIGQRFPAHGTLSIRSSKNGLAGTYVCTVDTATATPEASTAGKHWENDDD